MNISNNGNAGTITLATGNWSSAYQAGQGIFLGSGLDPQRQCVVFQRRRFEPLLHDRFGQWRRDHAQGRADAGSGERRHAHIAPVTINLVNESKLQPVSAEVTFGSNGSAGTMTLVSGASWTSLGYQIGQGIFVGSTFDPNANGATFNANAANPYYTIANIAGNVLTLQAGQMLTGETDVRVNLAPVTIDVQNDNALLGVTSPSPAGAGNNIIIGGVGDDTIDIGGTHNTVLGDDGQATYDATTGLLTSISTTDPNYGGNDTINVTGGDNAIIGGYGADTITVGGPDNTILGDNGLATFDPATGLITEVTTFTGLPADVPSQGGNDVIDVTSGDNVIIGGAGADTITIGGAGNTVLGDDGEAFFSDGVLNNNNALGLAIQTTDQRGRRRHHHRGR